MLATDGREGQSTMSTEQRSNSLSTGSGGRAWSGEHESAPSEMRGDDPRFARIVGVGGLAFVFLGALILLALVFSKGLSSRIGPSWGIFSVIVGVTLLLFHAAMDADMQIRRTYGLLGYFWLAAALFFIIVPRPYVGALFLPYSLICLVLGLLFLLPFVHNETDQGWRRAALRVLGGAGAVMALVGFVGGLLSEAFFVGGEAGRPYGVLLILLGFAYLWAFLSIEGVATSLGRRTGLAIGLLGLLVILIALGRSVLPGWFYSWGWVSSRPASYFVPSGLALIFLGTLYAALSACLCMDAKFIVLFRRELAAFFYSPVAYLVLLGYAVIASVAFLLFVNELFQFSNQSMPMPEPIVTQYLLSLVPVFCLIFAVPLLTMRLLSEENRTGSLEVLLTAPVDETLVVLSKLMAALVFFMLLWLPFGFCLIALRVEGGQPFEYRPLLIFYAMLFCSGAGFLSMGLFFSSLTRNQIVAAVLTFMGMLLLLMIFFAKRIISSQGGPSGAGALAPVINHVSFIDFWIDAIQGEITPRYYLFHLSTAVFWVFLTVKVLESRKWR
jgi:ABC-2 type transport system permease protein